tara:strand:- start:1039 stop:1230 length:192 start_codon:yes stop_codon:yes gene_type:complete
MPLSLKQFIERLAIMADPDLLCDVLDISSEDILERFEDVVELRLDILRDVFDVDFEEENDDGR